MPTVCVIIEYKYQRLYMPKYCTVHVHSVYEYVLSTVQ